MNTEKKILLKSTWPILAQSQQQQKMRKKWELVQS